jgi:hypothetical protein
VALPANRNSLMSVLSPNHRVFMAMLGAGIRKPSPGSTS